MEPRSVDDQTRNATTTGPIMAMATSGMKPTKTPTNPRSMQARKTKRASPRDNIGVRAGASTGCFTEGCSIVSGWCSTLLTFSFDVNSRVSDRTERISRQLYRPQRMLAGTQGDLKIRSTSVNPILAITYA